MVGVGWLIAMVACNAVVPDERRERNVERHDAAVTTSEEVDAGPHDARSTVSIDAGLLCERPEERLELDRACAWEHHPLGTLWFCPKAIRAPADACVMVTAPMTFPGGAVECSAAEPCWCCP
jgi:hypothetical protein